MTKQGKSAKTADNFTPAFPADGPDGPQPTALPTGRGAEVPSHGTGRVWDLDQRCLGVATRDAASGAVRKLVLTAAVDRETRLIVGADIAFDGPTAGPVLRCLKDAVARRDYWRKVSRLTGPEAATFGLPERIVLDNGSEFRSATFLALMQEHGIVVEYRRAGGPSASVRNALDALERDIVRGTLGTPLAAGERADRSS